MTSCSHLLQLLRLQPPKLSQSVHREECTQCFDNQDSQTGIDVCLTCFNGGCLDKDRHHARNHVLLTGHTFTLNIKRKLKPSSPRIAGEEPPAKITKLAVVEEREEDKYEYITVVKCWSCNPEAGQEVPSAAGNNQTKAVIDGVMQAMSSARQSEVKAWEEEILPCEHTLTLEQFEAGHIPESGLAHCNACDLKENLWLCLTCCSLGCGRKQFGGLDGNGHALGHYEITGHGVSVKLGTITPEGNADVFCYHCQDAKLDPELALHLSTFGINVDQQKKTEKSMTELQIELTLKYDFSLTGDDGKALEPVFGPGLTGLANLGNSCYMASVLQTLFSLPPFQKRYSKLAEHHAQACLEPLPANCVECQMHKVADGLLSGRYSNPANYSSLPKDSLQHPSPTPVFQAGIRPVGFKALIGKGHSEFSTMKQQDSEEFFTHLLDVLRQDAHKHKDRPAQDVTRIFSYGTEQRLQCNECKKVRYRVDEADTVSVSIPAWEKGKTEDGKALYQDIRLWDCLEALLGNEALEYSCPSCSKNVTAIKQTKFASFPETLVVHTKKFQLVNWVPSKLEIPVILPEDGFLEFNEKHFGSGLKPDEVELLDDTAPPAQPTIEFNENAMSMLEGMGFPKVRCEKALLATGNTDDAETAMNWLFEHMDDASIDDPIDWRKYSKSSAPSEPAPDPKAVVQLQDFGFTEAQAKKALRLTESDVNRAVEWLFSNPDDAGDEPTTTAEAPPAEATSATGTIIYGTKDVPVRYRLKAFISHKGPSVHSGHYVAHIRIGDEWILFNDEKVVKADRESVTELMKLAYLYVFERA